MSTIWVRNAVRWRFYVPRIDGLFTWLVLISFGQSAFFALVALVAEKVPLPKVGNLISHTASPGADHTFISGIDLSAL